MNGRLTCILAGWMILSVHFGHVHARNEKVWSDEALYGEMLMDLKEGWANPQGKRVAFPWEVASATEGSFHKTLFVDNDSLLLKQVLPVAREEDSLYVWIEQLSGEAELVINGQYWDVQSCRGGAWVVAIPQQVWDSSRVEIVLTVRMLKPVAFSPPVRLYVNPPICLLTREQLEAFRPKAPEVVQEADSIAIIPAYYRAHGWEFDAFEALFNLQPVLDLRLKTIFFPFPPDRRMLAMCEHYGLRQIRKIPDNSTVMWAAWYPRAPGMSPIPDAWWLDETARRTQYYGVWLEMDQLVQIPVEPEGRENIVYLLLGMLLYVSLLKRVFPAMFTLQVNWLWPGKSGSNNQELLTSLPGSLWIWMLSRWLMWGGVVTLVVLMLRDQGLWLGLKPERTVGVAWHWLSHTDSSWELLGRSVLLLLGIDVFRYVLSALGGVAFAIPHFVQSVVRLDLMASFPLVYLMGVPWAASMLYPEYGGIGVWMGVGLWLLHAIRLGISTSLGLQQFYTFSGGSIFLYICSLNVVPYFLLW